MTSVFATAARTCDSRASMKAQLSPGSTFDVALGRLATGPVSNVVGSMVVIQVCQFFVRRNDTKNMV